MVLHVSENRTPYKIIGFATVLGGLSSSGKRVRKYFLVKRRENQESPRWERERLRRQKAEFKTQFMSPLQQRTTDSLQSAPLSLKPGSTLVDNLWTLMDNWWTGDGCHPFLISFLFLQYVHVNLKFIEWQYTGGNATTIFHDNELLEEHFAMAHLPCIEHWGWLSILSLPVPGALIAIPTNYWPSTS